MFQVVASSSRLSARSAALRNARLLHSTPAAYKTVTEKVAEAADTVNKKVGKGLASAIEKGEEATQVTKEAFGANAQAAKEKADQSANTVSQKANQAAAGAREAKRDFQREVSK